MKNTLRLLVLLFAFNLPATLATACCWGPIYYSFPGHVYLPNGPITSIELSEFKMTVFDEKSNLIPQRKELGLTLSIKYDASAEWHFISYLSMYRESSQKESNHILDSLSNTLSVGDSIRIQSTFYLEDASNIDLKGWEGLSRNKRKYFKSEQFYVIKTEDMVDFARNADRYISAYPVPSKDKLTLDIQMDQASEGTYYVLDIMGRKLLEAKMEDVRERTEIDLRDLTAGNYYLYLMIDGEIYVRKLIKVDQQIF